MSASHVRVGPFSFANLRRLEELLGEGRESKAIRRWRLLNEPGHKVFSVKLALGSVMQKRIKARLPASAWAPTSNEYNGLKGWQKENLRESVDSAIISASNAWPDAQMGITRARPTKKGRLGPVVTRGSARRRVVVVTRYSTSQPDSLEPDVLGGKIPLDRLIHRGILFQDDPKWLGRFGAWLHAPAGEGYVIIDVHECIPR